MLKFDIIKYFQNKVKLIKNPYFLLLLIVAIAFFIRIINLKDNILFAYDQARDAQRVYNMVYKGDLKIVGPETDIQGIFNGPLLYYALAPVYYFSNFNPNGAVFLFIFINVATIFLVFWAAKILFNKYSIALIASLLWAFSYEQGFFARFISNASFMSTTTTVFFIGLALFFLKKKQFGLILSVIGIALAIHSNFYFIYLFLFYPLFFLLYRQKPSRRSVLASIIFLVLLLSPWIITELKWHFIGTQSLLKYFFHHDGGKSSFNMFEIVRGLFARYYNRVSLAIYYSFIPSRIIGFTTVALYLLYVLIKKRSKENIFLILWLLNTLPLFFFQSGVHTVEVINQSVFVPLTILIACLIYPFSFVRVKNISIISATVICLILGYNIYSYALDNFAPVYILTSHRSLLRILLKSSKEVVDYTYQKGGKEFGICSISEPLFINTVWSFLYSTYGKQKYGYMPVWTGQKQILNDSLMPYAQKKMKTKFIIEEPLAGIPDYAPKMTYFFEDTQNELVEKKKFGALTVQKRSFTKEDGGDYKKIYSSKQIEDMQSSLKIEPRFSCDITYE